MSSVDQPLPANTVLTETVYLHLRAIAQQQMNGERRQHTLTATALVHEAFLRIGAHPVVYGASLDAAPERRLAFLRSAAEAMRRILIEYARSRSRLKRGGGKDRPVRLSLDAIGEIADLASDEQCETILALDEAFQRLERHGQRFAEVVRLRFFAGLSVEETASSLGVSDRTVNNDWAYARAWLAREVKTLEGS